MPEFVIYLCLDELIVLLNFLLLFNVFFLLLYECYLTAVRVLEEILSNDIGTESRLLHHVLRRLKHYTTVAIICLFLY